MARVLVVADDLTGAAEIAGIGVDFGLAGRVSAAGRGAVGRADVGEPAENRLLAWDSDTRHLPVAAAASRIASVLANLPPHDLFYKKTDSAMRGNIAAELPSLMRILGKPRALLLAQNPSKGRAVVDGEYRIGGVPLDKTDFARDPEHPRITARVVELLAHDSAPVNCVRVGEELPAAGIIVACAATSADVAHWAERVDERTLPAGGADFFQAILRHRGLRHTPVPVPRDESPTLMVCGSASDQSRLNVRTWQARSLPVCPMPDALFADPANGAEIERWADAMNESLRRHGRAILAVTQPVAPQLAASLRRAKAHAVNMLLARRGPADGLRLFVEGGATAAAVIEALDWREFQVIGNLAPGVVALCPDANPRIILIIKPGSYPWPGDLWAANP